ncbi:MAG: SRPBCC domain-containing protein [Phycisphaerae bacterium]|nr:SRPBCC domain-containing protein [Gemmatimonadaceae bacterium]
MEHLNPIPLQRMYERWVRPYEALWATPLVQFKDLLEQSPHISHKAAMTSRPFHSAPNQAAGLLTVQLEISIAAPASRVWHALTNDVNSWWPRDFLASVNPQTITLTAQLGGQLIERGEHGGGVVWYTVYALVPGKSIDLVGQLSPVFGGPAQSLLRLELTEQGQHTVFALTDAVVGNIGPRTAEMNESGWRAIFEHSFRPFVEQA